MPRLLVRRPSPRLVEGELTHLERTPVDPGLAQRQWEEYVAAFAARGWEIVEVEPADEHPDGVFVEDAVVMFGSLAVLASPGAESRRGEIATVEAALAGLDVEVARIERPGTLDGGDVLKVGSTVYAGRSSTTRRCSPRSSGCPSRRASRSSCSTTRPCCSRMPPRAPRSCWRRAGSTWSPCP